jgi:hypothetical protein
LIASVTRDDVENIRDELDAQIKARRTWGIEQASAAGPSRTSGAR